MSQETINAQTEALSAGDFEVAYSLATPAFRSSVTLEALSQLIAASYGPLIRSSQLRFGERVSDETFVVAAIDVRFD